MFNKLAFAILFGSAAFDASSQAITEYTGKTGKQRVCAGCARHDTAQPIRIVLAHRLLDAGRRGDWMRRPARTASSKGHSTNKHNPKHGNTCSRLAAETL